MAKKPTLTTVSSGYQSTTQLNANLNAINNALDNTLSLDGSTPNAMTADIDLNSNDILNVATTHTTNLYLGGTRVVAAGDINTVSNMDVDEFTGNGSTVAYALSSTPLSIDVVLVNVDGVAQLATSYTLSVATLTFSEAPPLNSAIQIRYFTDIALGSTTSADLVSYSQGSTGHVTRTVETRLRDHVSVLDFGAVGDGVADDTAAIQAALNTGALAVYFPATASGYRVTTTLTVSTSSQVLYGDGMYASYINLASHSFDVVEITAVGNVQIRNLGAINFGSATSGYFINASVPYNVVFENIYTNGLHSGILCGTIGSSLGAASSAIRGCKLNNIAKLTGYGIIKRGTSEIFDVIDTVIGRLGTTVLADNAAAGILLQGGAAINLENLEITGAGTPLLIQPNADNVSHITLDRVWCDSSSSNGMTVDGSSGVVTDLRANQSWFSSCAGDGIRIIGNARDVKVNGNNQIHSNLGGGIVTGAGSLNGLSIQGNSIGGNGGNGIVIAGGTNSFTIQNNQIGTSSVFAANANGIVLSAGATDNFVISGNSLQGNTGSALINNATGTTARIDGNLGYNPVGIFGITVTASPFTYTASASPETVFINAGTVALITVSGVGIFQQSNCSVKLEPFQSMVVTYTVTPGMTRSIS